MNDQIRQQVREIFELLVNAKYAEIEAKTNVTRLSADEISDAIRGYGRRLVMPPDDAFELMDVIEVRSSSPRRWSVIMPIWTREEGRSDLSVELTLIGDQRPFQVELDDIHVL
jgi:hypothetical protein